MHVFETVCMEKPYFSGLDTFECTIYYLIVYNNGYCNISLQWIVHYQKTPRQMPKTNSLRNVVRNIYVLYLLKMASDFYNQQINSGQKDTQRTLSFCLIYKSTRDVPGVALVAISHKMRRLKKRNYSIFQTFNSCFDTLYVFSFYSNGNA